MREFEIITHNLANASTAGYKRQCNAFSKALEAQSTGLAADKAGGVQLRSEHDFSQGGVIETGRSLDVAIYGKGFLVIETGDGPLYTRNGMLQTNQNGQIVDSQGRMVAGQSGPITIPQDIPLSEVHISSDGQIIARGTNIGKLNIVDFGQDENKLEPVGGNCFRMTDKYISASPAQNVQVKQGYQESSNVSIVDELVDMIRVQRLYEANMKFISAKGEAGSSLMSVAMG
jgi:flagellar basal body rod protein FlgG